MAHKAQPRPSALASPAIREFLDELAEIIAEAILQETMQGTPHDGQNIDSATTPPEAS